MVFVWQHTLLGLLSTTVL